MPQPIRVSRKSQPNGDLVLGLLLHAVVHPADIQDRDGGILVMATLFGMFPFLNKLFADGGYSCVTFRATARTSIRSNGYGD
jgi:hypothetical protein